MESCSKGAYLAASWILAIISSFFSSRPCLVETRPSCTTLLPFGRNRRGSNPPDRSSSHSRRNISILSSFRRTEISTKSGLLSRYNIAKVHLQLLVHIRLNWKNDFGSYRWSDPASELDVIPHRIIYRQRWIAAVISAGLSRNDALMSSAYCLGSFWRSSPRALAAFRISSEQR